ncbi:MAG: flagellar biosynthetic protein FliO [Planctomycetota bacterium]
MRWNLAWLTLLLTVVFTAATYAAPPQSRYDGKAIAGGDTEAIIDGEPQVEEQQGWVGMARTGAALAFVVTLVVLLGLGYRKLSGNSPSRGPAAATVLARNPVSPRAGVVLLKVGRRVLVCSESAGQPLTTLSEITDRDEVAELEGRLTGKRSTEPETPFVMSMNSASAEFASGYPDPAESEVAAALGNDLKADEDSVVQETKGELAGLMERVRTVSRQFRSQQRGTG